MIHRDFTLFLLLLAGLRRIVLKELSQRLLQVPVVLIRVFLEVDSLRAIAAPYQLLLCGVIQVYDQRSDRNSRRLAGHATATESTQAAAPSPGTAAVTKGRQVDAFFLSDDGVIGD